MTVVLEDQVKTIAAELIERFGVKVLVNNYDDNVEIEDVVRAVIAMYDISDIGRMEQPVHLGLSVEQFKN